MWSWQNDKARRWLVNKRHKSDEEGGYDKALLNVISAGAKKSAQVNCWQVNYAHLCNDILEGVKVNEEGKTKNSFVRSFVRYDWQPVAVKSWLTFNGLAS